MRLRKIVLIFSLFIINFQLHCQESDFQTWVNIEVKGEILKKIDFSVAPEVRTFDNSSRIRTMICEIDLSVPLAEYFRVGIIYRPELDVSDEYASKINRYCAYGSAEYKLDRFKFSYRGIYQQEYKDYNTSENGHLPLAQHRHKIGIKYNIKNFKITPSAAAEMFFTLQPFDEKGQKKLRLSISADYNINKKLSCSVGYKFQREFYVNNPEFIHVLSLSLGYEF